MSVKEKFVAAGVEFTVKKKVGTGCRKCAFTEDSHLCSEAPDCSSSDGNDYHFKIVQVKRAPE